MYRNSSNYISNNIAKCSPVDDNIYFIIGPTRFVMRELATHKLLWTGNIPIPSTNYLYQFSPNKKELCIFINDHSTFYLYDYSAHEYDPIRSRTFVTQLNIRSFEYIDDDTIIFYDFGTADGNFVTKYNFRTSEISRSLLSSAENEMKCNHQKNIAVLYPTNTYLNRFTLVDLNNMVKIRDCIEERSNSIISNLRVGFSEDDEVMIIPTKHFVDFYQSDGNFIQRVVINNGNFSINKNEYSFISKENPRTIQFYDFETFEKIGEVTFTHDISSYEYSASGKYLFVKTLNRTDIYERELGSEEIEDLFGDIKNAAL